MYLLEEPMEKVADSTSSARAKDAAGGAPVTLLNPHRPSSCLRLKIKP